ncbi:MAG: helix-turn-helix transcriptional regulator [Sphaerotilus natans subsp. sulfidivorans]|uniref:helix-turn-helix domain-containing protein n=1 Tax=Sphaerotilus sulfidivorans TaxID=639200 RepID=UPI002354B4B7|nr:helix-turn-helix transcriptional regulator [Sphaerotilus sulfidivorans]MCK6403243.1 helix-turn-helix transcriptional regulator [Sphaerotilus sulfidivorans]
MALASETEIRCMNELCGRFGRAVRRKRVEQGWSQEELAARADLNRSYVGEIERGVVMPSLGTIRKLSDALQITLSQLMADCEYLS